MTTTGPTNHELPRDAGEMAALLEGLRFTDEPVNVPPPMNSEPLVVRSLRLPLDIEARARAIATERGVPVTMLMREWVTAGLAEAEGAAQEDPVTELGRILTEATRAYQVIAHRRDAA